MSRLLELLKTLPHRRFATASELRSQLAERGFDVDLRSVQRDLRELQKSFPLDHNDRGKPHGWRWSEEAAGGIASMSTPEALMIVLVQQQLRAALPATMLEGFQALFRRAGQRLDRLGPRAGVRRWPQKVSALPSGMPVIPPSVDQAVSEGLAEALLSDRQIDVLYARGAKGTAKAYRLHPLGLVLRGGTTYLAATIGGDNPVQFYAAHRFKQVDVALELVSFPESLDLGAALQRGHGQFGIPVVGEIRIAVELRCDRVLTNLLEESPLSSDQQVQRDADGRGLITARVTDSWELRWWLLGRGAAIEVLAPASLRREIGDAHRAAAAVYQRS